MAMEIPNPIPISCTTCHQAMRVEFQDLMLDGLVVAAERGCSRRIGAISSPALYQTQARRARPLIAHDIEPMDVGETARQMVEHGRELMARGERWIAAATWARGGKR